MTFIESLEERAAGTGARIVFPESHDPRVLEAIKSLAERSILRPVVIAANAALLMKELGELHHSVDLIEMAPDKALHYAAGLVGRGEVDGCVSGAVFTTAEVLRAAFKFVGLRKGIATLSSAFYMTGEQASFSSGVLTFSDCAVVPHPSPAQLADIAICAADDRSYLVGDVPRVALLSYSSAGSAGGSSVDTVREALTLIRRRRPQLIVDGELQVDAALVPAIAQRKAPGSSVAGSANILIFPSLDAGNIAYKLVQRLAGMRALGPILQGLAKPMADLSRGADVEDIIKVAAITALQSRAPLR